MRHLRDTHGFSLIEAMVASAILATAIVSVAQLLASAAAANARAGRITVAALLAAQKVEELRASPSAVYQGTVSDEPAPGFRREWSVIALASDPEHLALIDVAVRASGAEARMVAIRSSVVP